MLQDAVDVVRPRRTYSSDDSDKPLVIRELVHDALPLVDGGPGEKETCLNFPVKGAESCYFDT